ncbi:MAG: hypothetical protein R3B99_27275 [Polyangiales bacterium]
MAAELGPHYATALRMLTGAATNPHETKHDRVLPEVAKDMGRAGKHPGPPASASTSALPARSTKDPYFGGEGPDRVGCTFCGACMTGCRVGEEHARSELPQYLAESVARR